MCECKDVCIMNVQDLWVLFRTTNDFAAPSQPHHYISCMLYTQRGGAQIVYHMDTQITTTRKGLEKSSTTTCRKERNVE